MSLEDRFEIESPIHIGQVASAYPAMIIGENIKVLLKVIHPQWAQDEELVERFEREGETIASIRHPNVVKVLEFGRVDDVPYMALEWVEGGTLADRLTDGPLPQNSLHKIAKEILTGLKAVHETGMVHRDLKPDNILIGTDGHVRLADFSLAGFSGRSKMTEHGAVLGSPAYMAPELLDSEPASPSSDLYSVGIILLEALTGSNPYQSFDPMISLGLIRRIDPPILSGRKNINVHLANLVDALLTRPAERRLQSADNALSILAGEESLSCADKSPQIGSHEHLPDKRIRSPYLLYVLIAITGIALIFIPWILRKNTPEENNVVQDEAQNGMFIDSADVSGLIPVKDSTEIVSPIDTSIIPDVSDSAIQFAAKNDIKPEPSVPDKQVSKIVQNGYIAFIVRPWARVFLEDKELGITPLGRVELSPGVHDMILENGSFPPYSRSLKVDAGEVDTIEIDLTQEFSRLEVSAVPWGYLWIDSDSIGLLPRTDPVWINPGMHDLRITHPAFSSWRDSINVYSGESYGFKIDLKSGTMVAK
ncbi:MAG: serine/threonine protein kinase [Calditrichaeota bacterium]|nr:serine/threonine protein kinase [Calditrichota bacterium]